MAAFWESRQDVQVQNFSRQLAEAVEVILNPISSQDKRIVATRVCEEFKSNLGYLTTCGINLYCNHTNFSVKHFGLQLIQHAIKFNWNEMPQEEKESLKLLSLEFIERCTGSLLQEPPYLKDGIAKLTVEIMKREWPQQWPDVVTKLSEISQKGDSQLFTVLRTLLCLAEEATNTDGDLPPARRKDIMTSLSPILEDLFKFFVKTLQLSSKKMQEMKTKFGDSSHPEVVLQIVLAESVLTTLCGYVEWVNIKFLVQEDAILLQTLCLLLKEDELKLKAAECLEAIAGRKGPIPERQPLLILFSADAISVIFSSVRKAFEGDNDDKRNVFIKRVCFILSLLGQQLAVLWGCPDCPDVEEPSHFHIYLEALLTLHRHKSMLTSEIINKTWASFLRNSAISKNPTFCSFVPQILETSKTKISRALHPLLNSNEAIYPDGDFGSLAERLSAWTGVRASTKEIVQEITSLYPSDAFVHAAIWLLKLTNTPPFTSPVTESSPEYFEWDSLSSFASSVLNKLFGNDITFIKELVSFQVRMDGKTITISELSKKCIESLVQYETEAILIRNSIIMCLDPFIPFLQFHYDLLLTVIQKVFSAVSYKEPDEYDCMDSRGFKPYEYRRTAASVWVRLCIAHKALLINIIDDLTKHIKLSYASDDFTSMERSLLAEGLVVISNGYVNFEKQSKYLHEILAPVKDVWMSEEIDHALSSPEAFVSFTGLDNPNDDKILKNHRFKINMCLRFVHAVLKRTDPPKDSKGQINGGFKTRLEDEPMIAGASAVLPFLSNIFHLIRVLNSIWDPSVRIKIPPDCQIVLDIHESEKAAIFGIDGRGGAEEKPKEDKGKNSRIETIKTFLFKLNELCALILSDCSRLGDGYYNAPLLGQHVVNYVIKAWKHLPNYRLRNYIRSFFKMFCRVCPPAHYESAVVPVMVATCSFMIDHLNKEWEVVRNREMIRPHLVNIENAEIDEDEEADKDSEVIEGQLVHLLTKSFLESFFAMCTMRRPSLNENEARVTKDEPALKPDNSDDMLQELPKFLLKHKETCKLVLCLPFIALQWPDTAACTKAAKLCVPFIKQFVQDPPTGIVIHPAMFEQIFTMSLKAVQLLGHRVEIQSQLIRNVTIIYDMLRPLFPTLKNIFLQVPNIDEAVVNNYDLTLLSDNDQTEKQKKKMFKGLLSGLIGKEIGKMFQNDITILNLPAMPVVRKEPSPTPFDSESKDLGLIRLFEPSINSEKT